MIATIEEHRGAPHYKPPYAYYGLTRLVKDLFQNLEGFRRKFVEAALFRLLLYKPNPSFMRALNCSLYFGSLKSAAKPSISMI